MKILLHICCAQCAVYPLQALRDAGHEVQGFFYNPNIHPYQEYHRRLADALTHEADFYSLGSELGGAKVLQSITQTS